MQVCELEELVTRRGNDNHVHGHQSGHFIVYAKGRVRGGRAKILTATQRHINTGDIEDRGIRHDPLQRLFDGGRRGLRILAVREDLQGDNVRSRGHSDEPTGVRRRNTSNIGAMIVCIAGVVIVIGEVRLKNDPICDAVGIGVRPKERVVQINARVNDYRGKARSINTAKIRIRAERRQADQWTGLFNRVRKPWRHIAGGRDVGDHLADFWICVTETVRERLGETVRIKQFAPLQRFQ